MDNNEIPFRFPLTRVLPLLGGFLILLIIIAGNFTVAPYHPVCTAILWLTLIGSGWLGLSDLLVRVTVREDGLQIRSLSLRGLQTRLILWTDVQKLNLSGHLSDELKLWAKTGVSLDEWTLPAHRALAETVVRRADLKPDPANDPPGVGQALDKLLQIKGRRSKYGLHWQWRRVERELEDE